MVSVGYRRGLRARLAREGVDGGNGPEGSALGSGCAIACGSGAVGSGWAGVCGSGGSDGGVGC